MSRFEQDAVAPERSDDTSWRCSERGQCVGLDVANRAGARRARRTGLLFRSIGGTEAQCFQRRYQVLRVRSHLWHTFNHLHVETDRCHSPCKHGVWRRRTSFPTFRSLFGSSSAHFSRLRICASCEMLR